MGRCPEVPDQRGVVAGRSDRKVRGAGSASHCCMMVCNGGCGVVPVPTKIASSFVRQTHKGGFFMCTVSEQTLSVLTPDYWRTARRELNNPRVLAFSGLVCAMAIVLESLPIYLMGPSLKIYFSFLAVSLGCSCYGPVVGMMAGAIIDSVGFLLSGYGEPYFPGYLVTAVLSGLIYGVMLYRRKPTLPRIIVTRLIINYGSNVLLGSVWKAMLYGKGYLYYLTSGAVKNTIMLPIEVFLTWVVLNAAVKQGLDRKFIHKR